MSDSTPRLKLPELAQMQELNAATINEALAQLDAVVDLYLKGQFVNTPPSAPADGDAYLLGAAPTGAWSGRAYKIAHCLDGAWRFLTPFDGLRAVVAPSGAFIFYQGGAWKDFVPPPSGAEASVASAATCDIGSPGSLCVAITGTATITSFGAAANSVRIVRFAGALTLTHNALSLILPGAANRATAAGDVGIYISDAGGNWREISYATASGPNGLVKLATLTAGNSASLSDTTCLSSGHRNYLFVFNNIVPGTDGAGLRARYSSNGGGSYDGSASYNNAATAARSSGAGGAVGSNGQTAVMLSAGSNLSSTPNRSYSGQMTLFNPAGGQQKKCAYIAHWADTTPESVTECGGANYYGTTSAINAIQFFMSSGTIASGTIDIYGMK